MKRSEIKSILEVLSEEIRKSCDDKTIKILGTLFNLVEVLANENEMLRKTNQTLKDEVNRFKGEQGKPNIRKQKKDDDNGNHSSEDERKKRKSAKSKKSKNKKKGNIKIDREVICKVNKEGLPGDIVFKGYDNVVIQDIKIITDNVEFKREVYYSPSLKKTFAGKLPDGYFGEFGPGVRSLVLSLYNDSGMTEPALVRFFITFGIQISKATISRMITDDHDSFHKEKEDIIDAGLQSSEYQHLDDTGSRVNGKNHYTHILCNPYYTAYFTTRKKDRLTILEVLCHGELKHSIIEEAYMLMTELGLSNKVLLALKDICPTKVMTRIEIDNILKQLLPNPKKQKTNRRIILEASAIVYYQGTDNAIRYLICDDAPQFNKITAHKVLCWIHEGRHYKKLHPVVIAHQETLDAFIERFWNFYRRLLDYKERPSEFMAKELLEEFDLLFTTKTGYNLLDERIAMTYAKKETLLLVLDSPFLPLHNNQAELGARVQARKRDINLQTKNTKGTRSKDTFATIVQTAKKLSVNVYDYIYDRKSRSYKMPSLANLIFQNAS